MWGDSDVYKTLEGKPTAIDMVSDADVAKDIVQRSMDRYLEEFQVGSRLSCEMDGFCP